MIMRLNASKLAVLPPVLVALLLSTTSALPRDIAKERRLAEFLEQKPLHTTALLAGAATATMTSATSTGTPRPAMPTTALRSRVLNPPDEGGSVGDTEEMDRAEEVLVDQGSMEKQIEEYVSLSSAPSTEFRKPD